MSVRHSITSAELLAFMVASAVLTAAALLGLRYALEPVLIYLSLDSGAEAVHGFFFERSPVQWCTLCVFFFGLTVLTARGLSHLSLRRSLGAIRTIDPLRTALPSDTARVVRHRVESTRSWLEQYGLNPTVGHAAELAQRDEDALESVYALLGSTVQVMLALGFFGTVWGISRSMFGSFTTLSGAAAEQITAGLRDFTTALSTALDTTVLALACAIVASVAVTAMRWAEIGGLHELDDWVRRAFRLVAVPESDATRAVTRELSEAVADSAAQLRQVAAAAVNDLRAEVRGLTAQGLADLRGQYLCAQGEALKEFQEATERVRQTMEAQARQAVSALETQGQSLRAAVAAELNRVEEGLRRVPEISIRYPQAAHRAEIDVQTHQVQAEDRSSSGVQMPGTGRVPPVDGGKVAGPQT